MPEDAPTACQVVIEPQPSSVAVARDAVRQLLHGSALADLEDEAVLLVSEVVTNAVLHAGSEVELSCEIEQSTLCVEVRDRSPVVPSVRHFDEEAMTGRGLGLVELLASAWGVDPQQDGKTVWFQLAAPSAEPADIPARVRHEEPAATPATYTVRLRSAPAALLATTLQYGDTLLRELAFSSIAEDAFQGAGAWHGSQIDLGQIMDAVRDAAAQGGDSVDVDVILPVGSGTAAFERLSLIEEADAMARQGRLLTVAELPEVSACRRWLFNEIASQEELGDPVAWELPAPLTDPRPAEPLPAAERARLDQLGTAVVVADEANQIVYVNAEIERLLGWSAEELTGRRLITIVPPDLREAHLAGFGRFLLTRRPRLLGERVVVPGLHRDGFRVDVSLLISVLETGEDRLTLLAELTPVDDKGATA